MHPRGLAIGAAAVLAVAVVVPPLASARAGAQVEQCQPGANGAVFVTETCVDPDLQDPYTDKDEERTVTDPATKEKVRYRYVHGGFEGTDARFSLYFPTPQQYRGRYFQPTYPTVTEEDVDEIPAAFDPIPFAVSNGAYVVATNNGGGVQNAPVLGGYRVNAAAAKYSREVAARVYEDSARPRGYIYGASGGAYQTLGALENTSGVWDGGVPMVPGVPNAIPSFQNVQVLALRVLREQLPAIADATEPGGSGDPYATLDADQQAILREATLLGFPLRGWWQYATLSGGSVDAVAGAARQLDGTYADDFWSTPGYEGTDPSALLGATRIQQDATVDRVVGDPPTRLVLSKVPDGDLKGADVVITSGAAEGKSVLIGDVSGTTVTIADGSDPAITGAIRQGDDVRLDNSWALALQYYQRHSVPTPDQYGWTQFRDSQGQPARPQRPSLVGPTLAGFAGGAPPTGRFNGKMIMLASVMDVQAYPWSADWYRTQAQAVLGDALDDSYRLWFMDNADHVPPEEAGSKLAFTHVVSYSGELQQALLDLDAWVTEGPPPPTSTTYQIDADDGVELPATAGERNGVQPVVSLAVAKVGNARPAAADSVETRVGQPVSFTATAEVPDGAGKIVGAEWNFTGVGKLGKPTTRLRANHTYTEPGTYFPTVRVTSERTGDPKTRDGLVQNLARVRVVVGSSGSGS